MHFGSLLASYFLLNSLSIMAPTQSVPQEGLVAPRFHLISTEAQHVRQAGTGPVAADRFDLDPAAPYGLSIGAVATNVRSILESQGFVRRAEDRYERIGDNEKVTLFIKTARHQAGGPTERISHLRVLLKAPFAGRSADDLMALFEEAAGGAGDCYRSRPESLHCQWQAPASMPLVLTLGLSGAVTPDGVDLRVEWQAPRDLEQRLAGSDGFTLDTLDPLAPFGAAIGRPWAEAHQALSAAGFQHRNCDSYVRDTLTLRVKVGISGRCRPGPEPIERVTFEVEGTAIGGSFENFAAKVTKATGKAADCGPDRQDRIRKCNWYAPPGLPLVRQVFVETRPTYFRLMLTAVHDLADRLPPVEVAMGPTHWWDEELALIREKTESASYLDFPAFGSADPGIQSQVRREAQYIAEACQSGWLYSPAVLDCACLAGRVADLRVGELAGGGQPLDPKRDRYQLDKKAQDRALECVSRPAAASYGYKNCMNGNLRPPETCVCHAEKFSQAYTYKPIASSGHVRRSLAFASKECGR